MKSNFTYAKPPVLFCLFLCLFSTTNNLFSQVLLNSSFEGSTPWAGFSNNQSCCSHSVTQSTNHPHDGNASFRSEVRAGDPSVSAGWRAELTTTNINDQGDMWYGFSCYFETPVSNGNWTGSYGGHFVQWHPANSSGSAELAIYGSEGKWDVTVNPSGGPGGTHQTQTASGGPLKNITANVWHDVVFHVNWASTGGSVQVWIDGELYFTRSGLNWTPNAYLKLGMNRWGSCSGGSPCDTWVIYYDNVKIGRNVTYADVAPITSPPVNVPPTANAGNNINLAFPTVITTLNGSGADSDGTITNYSWSKVSGPASFTLASPLTAITALTGLIQGTYVFRLTVTDDDGATATDDVTVTVSAPLNQAPTASAGNDITLTLPANTTTLSGSGSDPDGTIASYAWSRVSGPTTFTLGSPNAASTTLSGLVQGTYVFRLTVTDNGGATATDNITVTVNAAPNQSPTVSAGNDIAITLPTNSTSLNGSASDADGTIASYAWTRVSGPTTFTLGTPNAATSTLSGLVQGTYVFRLTATDDDGATSTDNITVTVNPAPNQAPASNAGNNITLTLPANSTTLNGSGTDADGTIANYAWTRVSGPTTFTLGSPNAASTSLNGLVQGTYVFRLTVTDDDGATGTDDVTVTVNAAPNQAPAANAGNNITLTLPANTTTLNGSGTDADGTITSYAWTRVSGPATYTFGTPNAAITTLTGLVEGVYVFRLTVTDDDGATDTDDVTVTVNAAPNQAPIANAGNNITLTLPANSTTLNGSGTDADGTIATYAWAIVSGPATYTLGSPNAASTTLTGLVQGVYVFRLTVTDDDGATGTDDVTVTVSTDPNQAPIANAGNNIVLTLPANSTTLNGSGTDSDGTVTGYLWARVSGPATYTLGSPNAASTTLTGLVQGTYIFQLTVTDNDGTTGTDNVTVIVNSAPNQVPSTDAGNNITLTLPANSTTLNGSGADADGTIASYAWSRVSGPITYTFGSANAAVTTLTGLVQGTYVFRLTVTDDDGATATDDVTVTVNPAANQAPAANAGNNIILTLPTNSTTLNGGGTDPDGTITIYAWTRVSGPTTYTFGTPNAATTTLTGLVEGVYVFRLTVTDNSGATAADDVTVTVNAAPNQAPTANAGNNITLTLPTNSTTLNGSGNDADGTIANYAWTRISGPSNYTFGTPNAAATTLTGLVQGTYVFRLTVTDDDGATGTDDVTVTVNPAANQAPTANAGNNITLTLPVNSTTLIGSGADADGIIADFTWTRISGPTAYTLGSANASSTPLTGLVQGVYVFRLTVTDNSGATATDDVTVTVNAAPNQAPTANAGNDITITLPTNSTVLSGTGSSDPDGTITAYAWTRISGPTTYAFGNGNAVSTVLTNLVQGVYVFRLTVTDNSGATDTDDITVTVNAAAPVNQAPNANAGNDITITLPINSTVLDGTGSSDPDGTITAYAWTRISGPATYAFGNGNAVATVLTNLVQGVYVFRLTVTDNSGATDTDDITVTVNAVPTPVNQAPNANAGNDITITLPTNSTVLDGTGSSDPDGTITAYAWTRISGPATYAFGNGNAVATVLTNLVQGVYVFRLTVTDNSGATDTDDITVTVNAAPAPVNQAPNANAGNDITITLPTNSTVLNGTGSSDPDGTITAYAWTRISGPATYAFGNGNAVSTVLTNLVQGVYVFRLTVTDNSGATDTDDITVTVNAAPAPANQAPVANAGNDIVMTLPTNSTALNGGGSTDADGNITSYAWAHISGPSTYTFANANAYATNVLNLVQGVYVFRLTVTDNNGATDTDDITVTVNAAPAPPPVNQPPVANAGDEIILTLPDNSTDLSGTRSTDPDGVIAAYEWSEISGPSQIAMTNRTGSTTRVENLMVGQYIFQLKVTDNNGASATTTVRVTVRNKDGEDVYCNIYPNPVSSTLNILYTGNNTGKVRITIYNANKQYLMSTLANKSLVTLNETVDVSRYRSGTYFVEIILSGNRKIVKKFVVR
jgi:ribosomal protein L14